MSPANAVALYNPLPSQNRHKGPPLSILSVAAPLEKEGFRVRIFDANVTDDCVQKVLAEIDSLLCVGITCMTGPQIKGALEMIRAVKGARPALPVIVGGWHPTLLPEQTASHSLVDFVVRGQGEITLKELAACLRDNRSVEPILGLTYKKEGKVVSNPDRPFQDINDNLPMPYHLLEDIEKYIFSDWYGKRVLAYVSSFGCPHHCGFCAEACMSHRRWRGLAAGRVVDELGTLIRKYNLDGIAFYDSNFFVNENRVREIFRGLAPYKIKFGNANGSAQILLRYQPETWAEMEQSGCAEILIGAESGDDDILAFIGKGATAAEFISLKKTALRYHIHLWVSLMLGVPFDVEHSARASRREFEACTRFVKQLYEVDPSDRFALFIYTPYPGSAFYQRALECGVHVPQDLEGWSEYSLNTVNVPWISKRHFGYVDFLGNFIFVHSRPPAERVREIGKTGILKTLCLNALHAIAVFRIRHDFYGMRVEFWLIKQIKCLRDRFRQTVARG